MSETSPRPRSLLRLGVLSGALLTAAACLAPWARVRSADLFGTTGEVSAYLTPPGLMTLMAAVLTLFIVCAERSVTPEPQTIAALSTASLVPTVAGGVVVVAQWASGAGEYRSAPMVRTSWFYLALVAATVTAALALARWQRRLE